MKQSRPLSTRTNNRIFIWPNHVKEIKNKDKPAKQMATKQAGMGTQAQPGKAKTPKAPRGAKSKLTSGWSSR